MFAGVLNVRGGRLDAAIEKFGDAERIFASIDEPRALVDALMALASAQMKAGDLDRALANYAEAQVLCTDNDYQLGLAQLHADLGLLLQGLGRFPDAEQMLLKSFTIAEQQGEIAIAAVAAANLGLLYRETHDLDRAEQTIRQALPLETRLKHKDGVARATSISAPFCSKRAASPRLHPLSRKPASLRGDRPSGLAANAVYNLGNAHRALKHAGEAECCYRKALDLFMGASDARAWPRPRAISAPSISIAAGCRSRAGVSLALDAAREAGEGPRDRDADAESRRARAYERAA